jgi:hypothetical protein
MLLFFKDHFEKNVFNRNEESSYDDTIFDEIDPIPCDPRLGDPVTLLKFNTQSKDENGKLPVRTDYHRKL